MEETYHIYPSNVCSREMILTYDGDTITGLKVIGGCSGNLQGIGRLVKGRKISEVAEILSGVKCRGSRTQETSCPDQLAQGLKAFMASRSIGK